MQREHGGFTGTTHKDESHRPRSDRTSHERFSGSRIDNGGRIGNQSLEIECLGKEREQQDTDQETEVGKPGNDKGFLRSRYRCRFRIIESDQQIRRYTYQLPEDIHLENIRCHYQSEHGETEKRQEREIALEADFSVHIPHTIQMHHQRHGRNHNQHHHRYRIEHHAQIDVEHLGKPQPFEIDRSQCRTDAIDTRQ